MISISNGAQLVLFAAFTLIVPIFGNGGDNLIKLYTDSIAIHHAPNHRSAVGIVGGVKSCGGPAEVLEWRYETCKGSAVCQIPADGAQRRGELTLIPSETIPEGLGVRYIVTSEGFADRTYEMLIPDSAVKRGQTYTIVTSSSPKESFKGRKANFKYIVFRQSDGLTEACSEAVVDFI